MWLRSDVRCGAANKLSPGRTLFNQAFREKPVPDRVRCGTQIQLKKLGSSFPGHPSISFFQLVNSRQPEDAVENCSRRAWKRNDTATIDRQAFKSQVLPDVFRTSSMPVLECSRFDRVFRGCRPLSGKVRVQLGLHIVKIAPKAAIGAEHRHLMCRRGFNLTISCDG